MRRFRFLFVFLTFFLPDTAVVVRQVGDRRFGDVSADAERTVAAYDRRGQHRVVLVAVSYTHLDVYKRQVHIRMRLYHCRADFWETFGRGHDFQIAVVVVRVQKVDDRCV